MGAALTVFAKRETPSWPAHKSGCQGRVKPADFAFATRFASDAHAAQYTHPTERRLSVDAPARLEADGAELPSIALVMFDIDAHGSTERQLQDWRRQFATQAATLPGDPYGYFTRSGARLVWALRETWKISPARALGWRRAYLRACLKIWAHAGIVADAACADWTRLFRLPLVTRDGATQDWGVVCGNPNSIGTFPRQGWEAGADDVGPRTFDRLAMMPTWKHAKEALYPAQPRPLLVNRQYTRLLNDAGAEGALRHARQAILEASAGERNRQLYAQARWLYAEHVHRARFDGGQLTEQLRNAALDAGLKQDEIRDTLRSAWRSANANTIRGLP